MEKLIFQTDEEETVELYIVEQTTIAGTTYLLVADSLDDGNAYILKDVSDSDSQEACYEMVDDDAEIEPISRVFAEMLDDVDLEE